MKRHIRFSPSSVSLIRIDRTLRQRTFVRFTSNGDVRSDDGAHPLLSLFCTKYLPLGNIIRTIMFQEKEIFLLSGKNEKDDRSEACWHFQQ